MTPVADRPGRRRGAHRAAAAPFDELLAEHPLLARAARPAPSCSRVRGAGPLRQRVQPPRTAGRVLLVGDAAGYVDALTGEGIALGLAQARAAVEAIVAGDPERLRGGVRAGSAGATSCSPRRCSRASRVPGPCGAGSCRSRPGCPRVFGAAVNQLARPA